MKETLRRLVELEALDAEREVHEQEAAEIPARQGTLEAEEASLAEQLDAARAAIDADERRQRSLEAELADLESTQARLAEQQYEVTSRNAYEALMHEMGTVRESISSRESEILELMEGIEAQRAALAGLEEGARRSAAEIAKRRAALGARSQDLDAEILRLRALRDALAARIERAALDRYERIAKRLRPTVVRVSGEACPACRVGIPSQLLIRLLEAQSLIVCGSCHRLLVHERIVDPSQASA